MTDINTAVNDTAREILKKIDDAWPSSIVLRKDIAKFSCGLISVKSIATLDCEERGIPYTLINGKVTYEKQNVIKWLVTKIAKKPQEETRGAPRRGKNDILLKK
jgi:hypothetical protein